MFKKYDIKEIKVLTTSKEPKKDGFETEDEFRRFLAYELSKNCERKYRYAHKGIDITGKDVLVIFWYGGKGRGCGIIHDRVKNAEGKSKGFLSFYPETIFNISDIMEEEILWESPIPARVGQGSPNYVQTIFCLNPAIVYGIL